MLSIVESERVMQGRCAGKLYSGRDVANKQTNITYPIAPVTRVVAVRFTLKVFHGVCVHVCACPSAGGRLASCREIYSIMAVVCVYLVRCFLLQVAKNI